MRKLSLILALAVALALFASAPLADTWKWRTHGGVYGTRGISKVAYDRIVGDPDVPQSIKDALKWDLVRSGSIKPDSWAGEPYFLDSTHYMTYSENQGAEWLLDIWNASDAANGYAAAAWDNVSYYMGIASHYWSHTVEYTQHDNAKDYYEDLIPDPDAAYHAWAAVANHLKWQVEHYRPQDPALIGQAVGVPYGTLGEFLGNNYENARGNIYEFIENTMPSGDPMGGWLGDWIRTRKAEDFWIQEGIEPIVNGGFRGGSKNCIDMATELIYSSWVYALGIQDDVSTRVISWDQWWSRSHRDPGVVLYSYGSSG